MEMEVEEESKCVAIYYHLVSATFILFSNIVQESHNKTTASLVKSNHLMIRPWLTPYALHFSGSQGLGYRPSL